MGRSATALWIIAVVASVAAPAAAAGTGYVFVSHEKSDTVTVLDPGRDHAVVTEIATCERPRDMHFDEDARHLYVACGDSDAIDVIDVGSLEVVRQIPTGRSPEIFAFAGDWKSLYVSEEEIAVVRQIDIATGETLNLIKTGPEPEGLLLMPGGDTLYVTSEVADMVHVYDVASGKVIENILVGTRPRRFALTPDASELWVSDELAAQVTIIDTATNTVKETLKLVPPGAREVDVTPVGLALSPDGRTMYVALGRANHVAFVDVESREAEFVLVGSRAWGVAVASPRRMNGAAWAAYAAVKAVVQAAMRTNPADGEVMGAYLLGDEIRTDASKGAPMNFRAWDRQLRQPVLLATADATIATAPLPQFLHRVNDLDTLGVDEPETECRQ